MATTILDRTPTELLASAPCHTIGDTAVILGLRRRDGTPNRRAVHELIRDGGLRVVDPEQPVTRLAIASAEIERYIANGRP